MTTASDKPASPAKRAPHKPAVAAETPKIETVEPVAVKPAPAKAAKPARPAIVKPAVAKPVVAEKAEPVPAPAAVQEQPAAPEPAPEPIAAAPATSPEPVAAPVETVEPVAAAPAAPSAPKSVPTPSQPPILKVSQMTAMPTPTFKGYEEIAAFGKANIEAMIQANTVFSKGLEAISKEFIALTQAHMESTAVAAKAIFAAKTLKDVVELNAEFHKANFGKLVANSTKLGEMGTKVATDTFAPLSARVTSVVEKAAKPAA
jgi:phasin family protein